MKISDALEFFKFFLEIQSHEQLRIPRAYHKHIRVSLPRVFHLSDLRGSIWNVSLIKLDDELYFAHGWPKFVRDHSLETGDLLIFSCVNELRFKVHIFSRTGCTKGFVGYSVAPKEEGESKKRKEDDSGHIPDMVGGWTSNQNPRFTVTINKSNIRLNCLTIPMKFARRNNLLDKGSVVLRDSFGTKWPVVLKHRDHPSLFIMNQGWHAFSTDNDLKVGDICVFELLMDEVEASKFSLAVHINNLP
ncbi:hypothetical protein SAY86_016436 [Trapa natans]|uniref:TF-B3 domain-containing protein n=1 Tax=Trapa natans TaxID=22666 RepID=A0AAN7QZ50_TRANT|nr:hypothetical protein SAY86_015637 [Trapa natans]KAK4782334.1 hypothetical protein SAY86_016436 [Trapa natans]